LLSFGMSFGSGLSIWARCGVFRNNVLLPYESGSRRSNQYEAAGSYARTFAIPYWAVCLIALLVPFHWVIQRERERMQREWRIQGRGAGCGYDLRATPDRCPECGRFANDERGMMNAECEA